MIKLIVFVKKIMKGIMRMLKVKFDFPLFNSSNSS